ncbi:hypothetical protein AAFC00_001381 [Neodothiora populina]|uniref:Stress response RCI peptide n=1 Tax=Neodothiora populina TaxID=2781224 RepID=A0ABR3PPS8_9PEZI
MCGSDIFLGIIAIVFPPIAVWVKRGICSADSLINIALCCLGFLPGLLHAWYIISICPSPTYEQVQQEDPESGRVAYYRVQQGGAGPSQGQRNYGTVQNQFPGQQNGTMPGAQQYRQVEGGMQGGASTKPSGNDVPPTYAQAVKGDHKVQSHD